MPDTPFQFYKRNKLLSRVLLFTAAAGGLHAFWDLYQGVFVAVMTDIGIMFWMLLLYYLHQRNWTNVTRYGYLASASLIVLLYSSVVPRENGVNLLFLPLLSLAFVIFDYKQHLAKLLMCAMVIACYLLLEFTHYQLLGNIQLLKAPDNGSFIVNFLLSGALLYLSLNFITRANHSAEQHLQHLAEEMQHQNQELIKTNEELDRFVYSTSHDLRAPLLSVLGLVQLMEGKRAEDAQQPYLDMIRNRINNLESFINDITAFARNARLPLAPEMLELKPLVQEVITYQQLLYHDRKLDLHNEVYINHPIAIDRQRLLTVLNSLVGNAIKYHRMQHPQAFVTIGARVQQEQLHLWVADNGPGIAIPVQARMFDMFYRGDERSGGSGLGLYIAKETVGKLGGKIAAESVPGQGTTFHVWLPLLSIDLKKAITPEKDTTITPAEAVTA